MTTDKELRDRRVEPLAAILLECHEQDGMDSKAEAEAVVAWLDLHAPACVCGWLEVPTDRPEPIDEERLARALITLRGDYPGVQFDAEAIAAAYRTEPGETTGEKRQVACPLCPVGIAQQEPDLHLTNDCGCECHIGDTEGMTGEGRDVTEKEERHG